jgi:HK97 family phage prohead protease
MNIDRYLRGMLAAGAISQPSYERAVIAAGSPSNERAISPDPQRSPQQVRQPQSAPETKSARDLKRMDFECEVKLLDDNAEGVVEGYGSLFNLMDQGADIMLPGAFKASLADWKRKKSVIPMLWQHDPSMPIGVWPDVVEDDKGLKVAGELILDVPQATIARVLLKKKAIKGLSIGYRTVDYEIDRTTGARRLKKVDLWEISLVTFPMLPEAQITSVKNANFDKRELEDALRDAGISRSDAKTALAVFQKTLQRDAGENGPELRDAATDALKSIRKAAAVFSGA